MTDRLVKEVITTTTERFNDSGNIKEKITETREKVYETKFSKEQIDNAKVVNETPKKQEVQNQQALSNEELIKKVGEKLDNTPKSQETQPQQEVAQQGPFAPYQAPQYNVASRVASPLGVPQQQVLPPKMPWEQ